MKSLLLMLSALLALGASAKGMLDKKQKLVEWIVSRGGFFNPKQEYRSSNQVYATERIEKGQVLYTVPWDCILKDEKSRYLYSDGLHCANAHFLIQELKKGNESIYAPYTQYLELLPKYEVPSTWSEAGKDLLELICGYGQLPPKDPVSWLIRDWRLRCHGSTDEFDEIAAMLVLSRGDEGLMVPLFDFYSHANGKLCNADYQVNHGVSYSLIATRDIEKGEAIHISFNRCKSCNHLKHFGTPELLRDYGFVEPYPQSYHFNSLNFSFALDKNEQAEDGSLTVTWLPHSTEAEIDRVYLHSQLTRLKDVVKPELESIKNGNATKVPTHEWNIATRFFEALVVALESAIDASGGIDERICPKGTERNDKCIVNDGYDDLQQVERFDKNYQSYCDNYEVVNMTVRDVMILVDRETKDVVQSPYQRLTFLDHETEGVKDKCLELDDMLQICSSFRPHYHDYVTHFPARYKADINRVLFVGGGDAMLLHEMLKYPNIELIVGLELDQTVVRESMKQFRTSPHFEDERVQWWFGDATVSLLMLPKEYFGSFDLVMVDLSETVMAFSVIENLGMMETFALLLKPDGIMIKNDLQFSEMSDIFDYTIQLSVTDVPLICEQAFVLGSNSVDFLRPHVDTLLEGHAVKMQLLEPLKDLDDSFKLFTKYRHNNAREQGKCDNLVDDSDVKLKHAGLFMVIEAENAKGPLQVDTLEKALTEAIQQQGLGLVSTVTSPSETSGDHVIMVTREGVIVARTWPKEKYCAFDIHLWGHFNKMVAIRDALVDAAGSKAGSVSSFRIIVGGMLGTDTWEQDKQEIGPKIVQNRDCAPKHGSGEVNQDVIHTVVEETLNLIDEKDAVVAVLCGAETESCGCLDFIKKSDKVVSAVSIYPCSNIENVEFIGDAAAVRMSTCEVETFKRLRDFVAKNGRISSLVVDSTATLDMAKIVQNILANPRHQAQLLTPRLICVAPMFDMRDEWRKVLLDRIRKNLLHEFKFRVDMILMGTTEEVEVNVLSTGDSRFLTRIVKFADAVTNRTSVPFEISAITGTPPEDSDEYQPKHFTTEDYDIESGEEQFRNQKPLGHHIVSQLDTGSDDWSEKSLTHELVSALDSALKAANFSKVQVRVIDDVGDGVVALAVAPEGTGIAVWDGNQRVTVNMFTFDSDNADAFFQKFTKKLSTAQVLSKDEQPRGVGKVVNFARDLSRSLVI
jgi:spermidine synthase/S-adenosylmethionine/arginine decarboxylase-like enzyme